MPAADAIQSDVLRAAGVSHAFFTRRGGTSAPPFDSLHFGRACDPLETVQENFIRAGAVLGVPPSRLYLVTQVHGREVWNISDAQAPEDVRREHADALVTTVAGLACGVRTADCVPILLADRRSGAVAAVHSGWRGTVANVVEAAVWALRRAVGDEGDLIAAVGPHIRRCCFEVGADVATALAGCSGGAGAVASSCDSAKARVDLASIVRAQLLGAGVGDCAIDDVGGCTSCDPVRFFSYRRDGETSGRLLAAIVCRTAAAAHEARTNQASGEFSR